MSQSSRSRAHGLAAGFAALLVSASHAAVVYVDADATGSANGSTWADAYPHLRTALAAALAGDEIWVAEGTYTPAPPDGPRTATFQLRNGVAVYGGFGGWETTRSARDVASHPTVLSGDFDNDQWSGDNSFHVVNASGAGASAVLDGFIIRLGTADGESPHNLGAGLYCVSGLPTVRNCVFEDNYAAWGGGAMYLEDSGIRLADCTFRHNTAAKIAAGLCAILCDPIVVRCHFVGNHQTLVSDDASGGAAAFVSGWPTLPVCPHFVNCTFVDNKAGGGWRAGGIATAFGDLTVVNCLFACNEGAAVSVWDNGTETAYVANCTFVDCKAPQGGAAAIAATPNACTVSNSVFWRNTGYWCSTSHSQLAQIWTSNQQPAPIMTYCGIDGFGWDCYPTYPTPGQNPLAQPGNIGAWDFDPRFIYPNGGIGQRCWADEDWRLSADSPCMDAGLSSLIPPDIWDVDEDADTTEQLPIDLDGNPRVLGASVNMGAYEGADCNGNGLEDIREALVRVSAFRSLKQHAGVGVFDIGISMDATGPHATYEPRRYGITWLRITFSRPLNDHSRSCNGSGFAA